MLISLTNFPYVYTAYRHPLRLEMEFSDGEENAINMFTLLYITPFSH